MTELARAAGAVRDARRVVVLTGAGMSAESGVPTFRDAQTGLWSTFDPERLATPAAWRADRATVFAWYCWRSTLVRTVEPHAGHVALARLAERVPVDVVTQNVDDLHERAGSQVLAHLHGSLLAYRCDTCGRPAPVPAPLAEPVPRLEPPRCAADDGWVRPGVVWFDEPLPADAWRAARDAVEGLTRQDVLLVVGTSGVVQPAASLPLLGRAAGALVVEVNPVGSELSEVCHVHVRAGAAEALPELVG